MTLTKTWALFTRVLEGFFTAQAPCLLPSDATGLVTAANPAVKFQSSSRVYTGGITVQNLDASTDAWIGPSGITGSGSTPGWHLGPGEKITLPPVDVSTLYAYSSGAPSLNWFGLDLA
jgi:hypothetical protein